MLHEPKNKDASKEESEISEQKGKSLCDQLMIVTCRPWEKKDFPVWAEWLAVNEKPMVLLAEASKRPRRYDPWFCDKDGGIDVPLPLMQYRDVVWAFAARAMLRTQEGKIDEAWQDIMTCHRLARLVGQGPTLVEAIVAAALDGGAIPAGEWALLGHTKLSAAQIAGMQRDIASLPPLFEMANTLTFGERLFYLSSVSATMRKMPSEHNAYWASLEELAGRESRDSVKLTLDVLGNTQIDWDAILRVTNFWIDRIAEASRKPTYTERKKASDDIQKEIQALTDAAKDVKTLKTLPPNDLRKVASERIGLIIVKQLAPALLCFENVVNLAAVRSGLTQLVFALAKYRADHGSYPKKLAELTPKYVKQLPKDIFNNDADFRYESRQNNRCLVYSIGFNGRDDGGKGFEDCQDDIVVRMEP
jgi:hypothetical protein